jgi:hypothetical protein
VATRCDQTYAHASAGGKLLRCGRSKLARYATKDAQVTPSARRTNCVDPDLGFKLV